MPASTALGPITIRSTSRTAPPAWDERVSALGGSAFHGTGWADVLATTGSEPWFLEFEREGEVVGYALAGGARSRWPVLARRRSELLLQSTPVLRPEVSLEEWIRPLCAFADARDFGWLQCSAYASPRPGDTAELRVLGSTAHERLEFPLRLGGTLEETLGGMSVTHRRNVRKAVAEGFDFREDSSPTGAMTLRRLQDTTYARRWKLGQRHARPMLEDEYRRTMEGWLRGKSLRFWFVERDGEPLSALGILVLGPRAYYLVGGTADIGYQLRAPFAAFGHVIRALCAAGVTELHLGGVSAGADREDHPDHGLYRFKRGFGAEPVSVWDVRIRV